MRVRRAVLHAAGLESPSQSMPQRQANALLPLGRRTVLEVLLEELTSAGAEEIRVVVGLDGQPVERFVEGLGNRGRLARYDDPGSAASAPLIEVVRLSHRMADGCAAALLAARSFVGDEPFMFATVDAPIHHAGRPGSLLRRMAAALEATGADGVVAVQAAGGLDLPARTVVEAVGDPGGSPHFVVADFVRHPRPQDVHSRDGLVSRYVLLPMIFDYIEEQGPHLDEECLVSALRTLARDRDALWAVRMQAGEVCFDLSSFLLYSRSFIHFSLEDPEVGAAIRDYLRSLVPT